MVTAMIGVLLKERSMQKVIEMVLERVEAVRNDRVDVADLIVSKSLSKAPESYSPPTPASQVAIKILERGDADIPAPRVCYQSWTAWTITILTFITGGRSRSIHCDGVCGEGSKGLEVRRAPVLRYENGNSILETLLR